MFKFKGISSTDMQVVVEEEEHFIARASQRYEMTEIEGRDGAIFEEQGYSVVERPILVQCLNIDKIDDILAWLNGEGEFEYKGRKTIARFYSQLEPIRNACIRVIDTQFIRDPFWTKAEDEYETISDSRVRTTDIAEALTITDCAGVNGKLDIKSGKSEQATRSGKNLLKSFRAGETSFFSAISNAHTSDTYYFKVVPLDDNWIHCECDMTDATSQAFINAFINNDKLPNLKVNTQYTIVIEFRNVNINKMAAGLLIGNTNPSANSDYFNGYVSMYSSNMGESVINKRIMNTLGEFKGTVALRNFHTVYKGDKFSYDYRISILEGDYTNINYTYEPYGVSPSLDYPSEIKSCGDNGTINIIIDNNIDKTAQDYQSQTYTIPVPEPLRAIGEAKDYLADDGIHRKVGKVILNGTETYWRITEADNYNMFYIINSNIGALNMPHKKMCNYFKYTSMGFKEAEVNTLCENTAGTTIAMIIFKVEKSFANTIEEWKLYLAEQYANGTPVILEYELAEEEIVAYTPEQKEVYDEQLQNIILFEGTNYIYCIDEIGPNLELTYIRKTDENINNEGNIESRPIIRLEKTIYDKVELSINGIRFKYDFKDETYVEIDCENKTVKYDNLNRNRQIEIGYEFPKLKVGNNAIQMYSGDCIIKLKRKDRWL